jgi:hypothetical protein
MTETNADKIRRLENEAKSLRKQLKGLQMKIALREGLTQSRDFKGFHNAVYGGSDSGVNRNRAMLAGLHFEIHHKRKFPRKTDIEYKNADRHVKHKNNPNASTSNVYENSLTHHARRFKNIVEKGNGVVKRGVKINRQTPYAIQRTISAPNPGSRGGGSGSGRGGGRGGSGGVGR